MNDTRWRIRYVGPLQSITDAGPTFQRYFYTEITDREKAEYFLTKNRFEVEELGAAADEKKDLPPSKPNEKTSNESAQPLEVVVVEEPNNNPPLATAQDLANNLTSRAQMAAISSDPHTKQAEPVEKTKTPAKSPRKNKKPSSDFLDSQLLDDDDLK